MRVYVKGNSKCLTSRDTSYACKYMLSLLVDKQIQNKMLITVEFAKLNGSKGITECLTEEDDQLRYRIVIRKSMSLKEQLTTLAHELVHVKQFATGQFCPFDYGNKRKWMHRMVNCNDLDYWDYPWEIDAYGREPGLYHRYMLHVGQHDSK